MVDSAIMADFHMVVDTVDFHMVEDTVEDMVQDTVMETSAVDIHTVDLVEVMDMDGN
jgi:hypothetical protein